MVQRLRHSLPLQIIFCVVLGVALGLLFPNGQMKFASEIGKAVIHWVKLVAGPFLFLTVAASIIEVRLTAGHGLRLIAIALLNTAIAIVIGMGLARLFLEGVQVSALLNLGQVKPPDIQLSGDALIKTFMPQSLFAPLVQNEILLLALMALVTGMAIRHAYGGEGAEKLREIAGRFERVRAVPEVLLKWLIHAIPFAVLAVVSGSVSQNGLGIFVPLLRYIGVVIFGFCLQVFLVYGFWIFIVARYSVREFFRIAEAPVTYAFGVNSSLATLPLTLKALKELKVSDRSASLGAGVATNLNNDGIVLYEAMAVFFIAQLSGILMTEGQMLTAALACIVASMGITGIPEAGFISLSVVVSTLGLPAEALPLLLAVDWMVARGRSVVNVLSDMTLSIALDATDRKMK